MDITYFVEHIHDELEDSEQYLHDAIETKTMNAEWSKTLLDMSTQEMEHAKHMYSMLQQWFTSKANKYSELGKTLPSSIESAYKKVTAYYIERIAKLKTTKELY